jgi:hypothetical protein
MVPHPCRMRRAPLGAPVAADLSAPGRAFAVSAPLRSFLPVWVPLLRALRRRERRSSAFGVDLTVISQLLAGPRNGPGRSPGAWLANQTRRRRTSPRQRALRDNALQRTRCVQNKGGLECGDKPSALCHKATLPNNRPPWRRDKSRPIRVSGSGRRFGAPLCKACYCCSC